MATRNYEETRNNEYEIIEISDIFKVINDENIDRFCMDLLSFIYYSNDIKKRYKDIECKSMLWTDDGENKITGMVINGDRIEFKKK